MLNCMETLSVKVGRSEKVYVSWCENTVSESLLAVHCVEGYAGWSTKGYTEGFMVRDSVVRTLRIKQLH